MHILCYFLLMALHIILTGGTIDKHYNELSGKINFSDSHIDKMLAQARSTAPASIDRVMMKDSLDMTPEDRLVIARACEKTPETRIIIMHGTDTMPETAVVLAHTPGLDHKTIVLTGAMIPYSFGGKSDAQFNLGTAFAFAQALPAGVYIAMNGRFFKSNNVQKDKTVGTFTELSHNN